MPPGPDAAVFSGRAPVAARKNQLAVVKWMVGVDASLTLHRDAADRTALNMADATGSFARQTAGWLFGRTPGCTEPPLARAIADLFRVWISTYYGKSL